VTAAPGKLEIHVASEGRLPATMSLSADQPEAYEIAIELEPSPTVQEQVTVSATRTNQRPDDIPTRVEVLDRKDIEERMLMTPGDIVMLLSELGGTRVQATSPSLGAASVRIQGMRGEFFYTSVSARK